MANRMIIGLGGSCHDFSACAMVEGQVLCAVADERLSRVRYGLGGSCERPYQYVRRQVPSMAQDDVIFFGNEMLDPAVLPSAARRSTYVPLRHHVTHAAWAFHSSPFDRAAILVADGCGSVTRNGNRTHARETTSGTLEPRSSKSGLTQIAPPCRRARWERGSVW